MELIETQLESIRKSLTFASTRWKARARVVTSASSADERRQTTYEQQERDRPDDNRELEPSVSYEEIYGPDWQLPPEYPFHDFNYGP